jgi:hypothetical protein
LLGAQRTFDNVSDDYSDTLLEAAQLRRCLLAGHLAAGDGWDPVTYLGQVEAKFRRPREHY